ncbi:MAG: glycosyltransferase family 9 protein, partial [Chloroflexi bacterium]
SRIGDFLCAYPAFRALRASLPYAEISIITLPILKDLVLRCPYFDRYIPFSGYPGLAEQFFEPRKAAHFFVEMQEEGFDLAVQMQGSGVYANPFTLMLGAKFTAGYIRPGDTPGRLDAALPYPESGHEIERVTAMAEFLGTSLYGDQLEFPLWEEDYRAADDLLKDPKRPIVGMHISAREKTRRWPLERFIQAGCEMQKESGGTLVLIGEAVDQQEADQVMRAAEGKGINLCGKTTLGALGAVIDRMNVLITNDTGPAHIAYARKTPTVTIYGGGDFERYRPKQPGPYHNLIHPVDCRPCTYTDCPIDYKCLTSITVEMVLEGVMGLLKGKDRHMV